MPSTQFPVLGCRKWNHLWSGRKDGYPLPYLSGFTLLLSPNVIIDANTRICEKCYTIHRRPNAICAAARASSPLLCPAPFWTSSRRRRHHPHNPLLLPPPPPPLLHLLCPSRLSLPPPPPPPPLPSSAPRPLSDITNTPLRQRRHSTPLKRKRELVEAAAVLSSPEQRKQLCVREGVSGRELRRYAEAVTENEQRLRPRQLLQEGLAAAADQPRGKKRRLMTANRLSGAGRKPALTAEHGRWLRDWVLSLRRCDHHFAVAEIHIQLAAQCVQRDGVSRVSGRRREEAGSLGPSGVATAACGSLGVGRRWRGDGLTLHHELFSPAPSIRQATGPVMK